MLRENLGRVIAGRYLLVDILGEGGMATVFCAVDRETLQPVAVKLLKRDGPNESVVHTRFHREARAIAKLRHPGFAKLLDWGIERGAPFMVMELVRGESLSAVVKRHARVATHVALRIAIAVCELLEQVHARGLVHRDIKPSNIMVQSLEDCRIKLIDFGIAKHMHETRLASSMAMTNPMALTTMGTMLGSPPYCSPEQLRGEEVDLRTDIYATGVLLYRMVTGVAPFRARHSLATACKQLSSAPEPPSEAFPFIDDELEEIILRCMARAPEHRFATATDLRAALSAVSHRLEALPLTVPTHGPKMSWIQSPMTLAAAALAIGATSVWLALS